MVFSTGRGACISHGGHDPGGLKGTLVVPPEVRRCCAPLCPAGRMNMDAVAFHREPLNLPTMVVAFGGWIDAGEAVTGAMRYLVRQLAAAPPRLTLRTSSILPRSGRWYA